MSTPPLPDPADNGIRVEWDPLRGAVLSIDARQALYWAALQHTIAKLRANGYNPPDETHD